ncbi:MAG: hypothetical protein Fur0010_00520 [Bdellovibrio sp.]
MNSYEKDIATDVSKREQDRVNISLVKYFWQANHLSSSKENSIPKFLKKIDVLKNFSDNELRILANSMHFRRFSEKEVIFRQNDVGIGFYFIYSGRVDVIISGERQDDPDAEGKLGTYLLSLSRSAYFGELALLQENSLRNATVIAREPTELLGIFKPDIETLIQTDPAVVAKLLQSISLIVSQRLTSMTREIRELKYRISELEKVEDK